MTANDPPQQQEAAKDSLGKAFDVFDERERAHLHTLEKRPKRGSINSSSCEGSHSSSLLERLYQRSTSTHQNDSGPFSSLVLLSSSLPAGLALDSRNFACQLLEGLGHCYFSKRVPPMASFTGSQISGRDSLSTDRNSSNMGTPHSSLIFVGLAA